MKETKNKSSVATNKCVIELIVERRFEVNGTLKDLKTIQIPHFIVYFLLLKSRTDILELNKVQRSFLRCLNRK
jgi:hypothetical protein